MLNYNIVNKKYKDLFLASALICMAINVSFLITSVFVGSKLGYLALSTIQLLIPLASFVTVLEYMFGIGGQILCSNFITLNDENHSSKYFTVSIVSLLGICCLITVIGIVFLNDICSMLSPSGELIPYLKDYLPYILINFPIISYIMVLSQFIRIDNYQNLATASIIASNILNILFSWIFITILNWGMFGAGIANLIGNIVGAFIISVYMLDDNRNFRFNFNITVKSWFKDFFKICKAGFPSASMELYVTFIDLIMNFIIILYMGDEGLAIYGVCTNALLIMNIIILGVVETMLAIETVYYSKHDYANVKHIFNVSLKIAIVSAILYTSYLLIFPQSFIDVFINTKAVGFIETAVTPMRLFALAFLPMNLGYILLFYTQSIQKTGISSVISIVEILIGPLFFTFLLIPIIGNNGIWISFALGYALSIIVGIGHALKNQNGSFIEKILYLDENINENSQKFTMKKENKESIMKIIEEQIGSKLKLLDDIIDDIFLEEPTKDVDILVIDSGNQMKIDLTYEGKFNFKNKYKNIDYNNILGLNDIHINMEKCKECNNDI